jgi:beta-lactamase regulating signal transducer with metallopeptidase domain
LACVWAGLKLLRVQSPALRHHVWLLGMLIVSLIPLSPKVVPALPESRLQPWPGQALRYTAELPSLVLPLPVPPAATNLATPPSATQTKWGIPFSVVAFCVWLIGACAMLVSLLRNLWRLHRIRLNAEPVSAAALGCATRLNEAIPLRLSTAIQSPVLHGVLRPVILLPHDLSEWTTAAERGAMIEHELAHVRRRDHYTNLLLNALNLIFYFHPLVRYACRQIRLEREIACDDYVVATGADAAAYAESILKAAERCLAKPRLTALHQPAFFTKQTLERRLEMILNQDRMRVLAQQWKYLLFPTIALMLLAWLLIPAQMAKPGLAQTPPSAAFENSKTSDELLDTALKAPDAEARLQAANQLAEKEDFMSKDAVVALYNRSNDTAIKELVIHTYIKRSDIQHLAVIARFDESPHYRALAAQAVSTLKATSDNPKIRQFDLNKVQDPRQSSDAPPPPPPPPPAMMSVEAGKALTPMPGHQDDLSAFGVLRQLTDAHIRRDTSVFERLLADDYIGYGPNGESFNKAEELAEVRKLDYTVTKFEFDDLRVSGNPGMSVATFLGTVYYQANGQDATVQYRYTATMVRLSPGGPLRVISIHMSRKV